MRLVIAGSRSLWPSLEEIDAWFMGIQEHSPEFLVSSVICGCATGVDRCGATWARFRGIPIEFFPGWNFQEKWAREFALGGEVIHPARYGNGMSAGFLRNRVMASAADGALLYWNGKSRGTRDMANCILALNKPCWPLLKEQGE